VTDEETRTEEPTAEAEEESNPDLIEELDKLGRDVTEGLTDAWRSDERKEIQGEIEKGLGAAGRGLGKVARDARESEAAQGLGKGAREAGKELKAGLLSGLRFLNRELGGGGGGSGGGSGGESGSGSGSGSGEGEGEESEGEG
jgi:hypothetical protein